MIIMHVVYIMWQCCDSIWIYDDSFSDDDTCDNHKIHGDEDDHDTFCYNNACNVVTWDDIV